MERNNPIDIYSKEYIPLTDIDTLYIEKNQSFINVYFYVKNESDIVKISNYGVCWSTQSVPTIQNYKINKGEYINNGITDELISISKDSLILGKVHFFRSFIEYNDTIIYSEEKTISYANFWMELSEFKGDIREDAVGFSIGNKGYITTGWNGNYLNDVWEYDINNDSWQQKSDFPGEPRRWAISFSLNNKGYIGTGYSNNGVLNDIWEYDPETEMWRHKSHIDALGRYNAVAFTIADKAYLGTGTNGDSCFSDFWEFDPLEDIWLQKANFKGESRYNAIGFSIDGKGYIGTGCKSSGNAYYDFWVYYPSIDNWAQKSDFANGDWHSERSNSFGFSSNNKGYIGKGSILGYGVENDIWEYDPENNEWIQIDEYLWSNSSTAALFTVENKTYFLDSYSNSFYVYITKAN